VAKRCLGKGPSFLLTGGRATTANVHVGFSASETSVVDAFHAAALANGGKDNCLGPQFVQPARADLFSR
jgi:hypothetical protein